MASDWDGFYAAYMTGADSQGFGLFTFLKGHIAGADPMGVQFRGTFEEGADGSATGKVQVKVPPGGTVIQGASAGPAGMSYEVEIKLDRSDIEEFIRIETPLGPVNVRLKKLMSPPEAFYE